MESTPIEKIQQDMPDVMRCLTEQFVAKSEANERAKIRRKMKALLDFLSADTTYPALPKGNANPFGLMPLAPQANLGEYYPGRDAVADGDVGGGISAIPGAENNSILEEGVA